LDQDICSFSSYRLELKTLLISLQDCQSSECLNLRRRLIRHNLMWKIHAAVYLSSLTINPDYASHAHGSPSTCLSPIQFFPSMLWSSDSLLNLCCFLRARIGRFPLNFCLVQLFQNRFGSVFLLSEESGHAPVYRSKFVFPIRWGFLGLKMVEETWAVSVSLRLVYCVLFHNSSTFPLLHSVCSYYCYKLSCICILFISIIHICYC
jgi:hypothetical protein